jgi:DNA helicase-2/ATP-dependent DNA helicase PcrA
MEEERRLMYVACTRAKVNLFITYPINVYDRDSGTILTKPSRFLEGLDDRLIEPWIIENS